MVQGEKQQALFVSGVWLAAMQQTKKQWVCGWSLVVLAHFFRAAVCQPSVSASYQCQGLEPPMN